MKTLLFLSTIVLVMSCRSKKNATVDTSIVSNPIEVNTIKPAILGNTNATESNAVLIEDVVLKGNVIYISISYSGGCEDHFFDLMGNQNISKSLPPLRSVKLIHTGKTDSCRELITKTLEFDISNLAYKKETGSEIVLNIEGWKEAVRYVF